MLTRITLLLLLLNVQATLAMHKEVSDGENLPSSLATHFRTLLNDVTTAVIDKFVTKIPNYSKPFFPTPEIPAELVYSIISDLCEDENGVENLSAISGTCTAGYHLSQDPKLWEILKKTYASHLPSRYIAKITSGKGLPPLDLARSLLQECRRRQTIEINRLCDEILSDNYHPPKAYNGWIYSLENLTENMKKGHLNILVATYNVNKENSYSQIYWNYHNTLEYTNSALIEFIIQNAKPAPDPYGAIRVPLNFEYAITRLTTEGIQLIKDKITHEIFCDPNMEIRVDLANNSLTYLPDDLFSIGPIHSLCVYENPLSYVPETIINLKESLRKLSLGESYKDFYTPPIPSCICQLKNLTFLEIRGNNVISKEVRKIKQGLSPNLVLRWEGEYVDGVANWAVDAFSY